MGNACNAVSPAGRGNERQSRDGRQTTPAKLGPDAQIALSLVSDLIGQHGHAIVWALNYEDRMRCLPSASKIIIGVFQDLGLEISESSAHRALRKIRRNALEKSRRESAALGATRTLRLVV